MSLVTYEPWTALRRLHRDMDYMFKDARETREHWVPAVDIVELDNGFDLLIDIPGANPDDIEITAEKGELTISGKRGADSIDSATVRRAERARGEFKRRFQLPETADTDGIEAKADLGVLTIHIPKKAQLQPRRIDINVG